MVQVAEHPPPRGSAAGASYFAVVLDRTIFHPQGGGQPFDTGVVASAAGVKFTVSEVRANREDGVIQHIGTFAEAGTTFQAGDEVELQIDEAKRRLHARLHSAGHLLDKAVANLFPEYNLIPDKGYHFADAPYVEYKGTFVPADKRQSALKRLEDECNRLIAEGSEVTVQVVHSKEEVERLCGSASDSGANPTEPVRVVTVCAPLGCPCGGTHVQNTGEIGRIAIPKMSAKKGVVRISYTLLAQA